MTPLVDASRPAFAQAIEHLKGELQAIRGNRAHPSLVEEVKVEVYGATVRLKEVAGITVPEARTIVVQPWDKNALKDIERALNEANLGLGVVNDGSVIRLNLPPLTAESRQQLTRVLHQKLEGARVQLRQIREKVREQVVKAERDREITEDDRYRAQDALDELVREHAQAVDDLGRRKEEEILTV